MQISLSATGEIMGFFRLVGYKGASWLLYENGNLYSVNSFNEAELEPHGNKVRTSLTSASCKNLMELGSVALHFRAETGDGANPAPRVHPFAR